jgi:hypothetical protein
MQIDSPMAFKPMTMREAWTWIRRTGLEEKARKEREVED